MRQNMEYENLPINDARQGLIKRLWRGNVRLPITYWVFGALAGAVIGIIYAVVEFNYIKIVLMPSGTTLLMTLAIVVIIYQIFWSVATWRSAGKYNGSRIWKVLARIAVILGLIQIAAVTPKILGMGTSGLNDLQEEIAMINKSAPSMVDSSTRLDHVSLTDKAVIYNFTVIDRMKGEIDRQKFEASMAASIKTNTCEGDRKLFESVPKASFFYRDKMGDPIGRIDVTEEDCL